VTSARIVLLVKPGDSTNIVFNALARSFDVAAVFMEARVPQRVLLGRRVKKLGLRTVVGQLAFRSLVVPVLARKSEQRIREICAEHGLDRTPVPERLVQRVPSVNSDELRHKLRESAPQLVVVNGTRIISKETLSVVSAPFVNTHAGITPLYRGVHGGYWALAENDRANCGVTVHLVDTGIDTGGILAQGNIYPTADDNFTTYPYLQYAAAVPLLATSISALLGGTMTTRPAPSGTSRLWSHPTLGQYLKNRLLAGTR
jgi:folate-dependent phosphoribosylglycinamide formyltransferase PurN